MRVKEVSGVSCEQGDDLIGEDVNFIVVIVIIVIMVAKVASWLSLQYRR